MDWWTDVVFRITGPDDKHPGQGTGFVFGRDDDGAILLVTCWHVVREIGRNSLHIRGLRCEVVSEEGDDSLDLAVLRVPGLSSGEPLTLASVGTPDIAFETFGYEPTGRPLSGTLDVKTYRSHASHRDVPAWDYYLDKGSPELKKIRDGYSGAPVFDPNGRRVVAVITHRQGTDKGFAIDIANLPRVYPRAADFIADVQADSDGEYATEIDHPLVKMLDHTKQLAATRELLKDGGSDRAIVLVEACPEDWPSYLADHVHLDPWPDGDGNPPEAITLGLKRFDEQSFWEALLEAVPNASRVSDKAAKQIVVCWINGTNLRVLYLPVGLERHGRHSRRSSAAPRRPLMTSAISYPTPASWSSSPAYATKSTRCPSGGAGMPTSS